MLPNFVQMFLLAFELTTNYVKYDIVNDVKISIRRDARCPDVLINTSLYDIPLCWFLLNYIVPIMHRNNTYYCNSLQLLLT